MGRNKSVVCEKCYRVMRSDHLKRHTKVHQKRGETTQNVDKKIIIQKLIKAGDEYTIKRLLGEKIHRNIIKHAVHEANIPIEYQESYEIYMKEKKTDESGINSNQSEMFEDNWELSKIYELLQRMTNKNV